MSIPTTTVDLQEQLRAEREQAQRLQGDCQRLQQTVKQLEEEREWLRHALRLMEQEREAYRQEVYAQVRDELTEEDKRELERRIRNLDKSRPHAHVIEEMKQLKGISA